MKNPEPGRYYSMLQVYRLGFFPWINSYQTLRRFLFENMRELAPKVREHKTKSSYHFEGARLLKLQQRP